MVNILVLSHMYPSKENPISGIFVHKQILALRKLGCNLIVIKPIPATPLFLATNARRISYRRVPDIDMVDNITVYYPRYIRPPGSFFHGPSVLTMYISVLNCLKKIIKDFNPQVIYAHTATPDGYVGLKIKERFGLPNIVTLHGSDINLYPFKDKITYNLTKQVILKSNKIISVSKAIKNKAEMIAVPQEPIEVIYNGVNTDEFIFDKKARVYMRQKIGVPLDKIVLIFVGNLLLQKGVMELLNAFYYAKRRLEKLFLIIVGEGPANSIMKNRVKELKIEKDVYFAGSQPNKEINNWLSASDILVLPSWSEGHPIIILEAMSCSRAVIATNVGGISETIVNGKNGILIEKGDEKALIDAMIILSENDLKRNIIGQEARKTIENWFTWDINAAKTMMIFKKFI